MLISTTVETRILEEQIKDFSSLKPGWDFDGSGPISQDVIDRAFMRELRKRGKIYGIFKR